MSDSFRQFKIKKMSIRSKASRIFYFFKPKEPVVSEEFDLGLTIINLNQETYKNGYVSCISRYTNANVPPIELRFPFETIEPNEEKELWTISQIAFSSGTVLLHDCNLICEGKLVARGDIIGGSTIPCHSFINLMNQPIDWETPLIFSIASRDELYQKYSVVVAIWTSITAILISTASLLISLMK